MKFVKYNSLENHYQAKVIDIIRTHETDESWVAREKIHGANFSFWYDGSELRCAKRSGFIGMDSNFYGWQDVYDRYKDNVIRMYNSLVAFNLLENGQVLTVYGELAGDLKTGKKVQREVQYGDLDFWVFDVCVNGEFVTEQQLDGVKFYGLKVAPVIAVGPFETLIKLNNHFQSVILKTEDENICEGFVLKPNKPRFFGNGSRVAIKSKNAAFSEKRGVKNKERIIKSFSEVDTVAIDTMTSYVTENRLKNVLSKFGPVEPRDFNTLMMLFVEDIMDECYKENNIVMEDSDRVIKYVKGKAAKVLGFNFKTIVQGSF